MKYNRKQEIVQIAVDKIKPYPGNPRINEQAVPALMENIRKMGFRNPLYLAPDLTIIAGHTRLKAARALGMTEVDCIIVSDLTEAEMREMRLSDNRLSEFAKWDLGLLHEEVEWLEDDGADLEYLDLDEYLVLDDDLEISDKAIIEDEVPEVDEQSEPTVKFGEIWQLGRHRLMCGDSTNKRSVSILMGGNKADMVFTDPPYGIEIVGNNGKVGADNLAKNGVYMAVKGDETTDTARKFFACCKELGFDKFILFGGNYFVDFLPFSDGWVIWDKRGDMNSNNFADGEMAWCFREGEREKRVHPTQKPVKLLGEIISDFTKCNDIILDSFGGSGSTLIACEQIDRICYMMEYEPHYCDVIINRWENLTGQKAIKISE